ncbi:MUC4 isoform 18, partial [Pan troglodytes]
LKMETSGMTTPSLKTDGGRHTATSPPPTTSQTIISTTPSTAMHTRSTAAPIPILPEKGVSLFPYGAGAGDLKFVRRTVDFTSPLFKPATGFPLGSSLRDSLYASQARTLWPWWLHSGTMLTSPLVGGPHFIRNTRRSMVNTTC